VTVPPETGPAAADGAVDAPGGVVLVQAEIAIVATNMSEVARNKKFCMPMSPSRVVCCAEFRRPGENDRA